MQKIYIYIYTRNLYATKHDFSLVLFSNTSGNDKNITLLQKQTLLMFDLLI